MKWTLILVISLLVGTSEAMAKDLKKATFAAGCFWGVEKFFWDLDGVVSTQVGYAGGHVKNPSYEQVVTGTTGHAEAMEVTYDPTQIHFKDLLITFYQYHDPTQLNRQGPDIGSQYRSAIFYHDSEQKFLAEESKKILDDAGIFKSEVVTEVTQAGEFYRAEEYHQKYLKKNPNGYCSHHFQGHKIGEALQEGLKI